MKILRRWAFRVSLVAIATFVLLAGVLFTSGWRAFGHRAEGARLERMKKSPQWHDGHFENPQPLRNDVVGSITAMWHTSPDVSPHERVRCATLDASMFDQPPPDGVRFTWFGHSSVLVEIDGHRFLTDPIWSERSSPISFLGPKRWFPPPLPLNKLPKIDAVLISHDHYDHLDMSTVMALGVAGTRFIVPLGIGAHLEYWGIPASQIVELDWWEHHQLGEMTIAAVPARHASGRVLWDYGAKLWAGFAVVGPAHRVYYSGDTGMFPAMTDIGERYGPFDLAIIEAGQYHRAWPDWHIGPEQAVRAQHAVKGKALLPVHWALFQLAAHGWTEPVERVLAAVSETKSVVATPAPGESFSPAHVPVNHWWPKVAWQSAQQHPIVSTQLSR